MATTRRVILSRFQPLEDRTTPTAALALSNNSLLSFDTSSPGFVSSTPITGLGANENLVGIDYRPQTGGLYGLTSNGQGGVRLYTISTATGKANPLTDAAVTLQDAAGVPVPIAGNNFGMDFNPTVDRLRIVTDGGINFRINPNTGLIVDSDTNAGGIQADKAINGGTTKVDATAYTNNAPNAAFTTQYTLDASTDKLFIQSPPNDGTQVSGIAVTVGGSSLDFTSVNGFDIPAGVAVNKSNDPAAGVGFAALNVGGSTKLYGIDLTTGKSNSLGSIGSAGVPVQGLAVAPLSNTLGTPFVGLAGQNLIRFNSLTPGTIKSIAITGVDKNEVLVGIDQRPATGQVYGLAVNAIGDTGSLYLIDPQTAIASRVTAEVGQIVLTDAFGAKIDLPSPTSVGYGLDFNPTVDKLRVVAGSLNFRINPVTGLAVDSDTTAAGTQPDKAINGLTKNVDATAYTNNFNGATATTQYTLDSTTDKLYIQSPPNDGTQTNGVALTLNGTALDFGTVNAFDIPPGVRVTTANGVASGRGFAALTVNGITGLYTIDLTSGKTVALGTIDTGTTAVFGLISADVPVRPTATVGIPEFAVGSDRGSPSSVVLYGANQAKIQSVSGFDNFTGGVRTAAADFNGDGVTDIVAGTGPGAITGVRIISGKDATLLFQVQPFEASFTGGVYVTAGDLTGDGVPELVISPDEGGGPRVQVINGRDFGTVADFFGIADTNFRGGARTAIGDANGDGLADLGVAAGFGGGPRIAVFDGKTLPGNNPTTVFNDFFAFEQTLRNGVFLALGDTNGDGKAEVIAGGGPGGGPRVTIFDGNPLVTSKGGTINPISNFFAGDPNLRGGMRVTVKDLDGDNRADVVTGTGPGSSTRLIAYAGTTLPTTGSPPELFSFDPFSATTGVFVG